MKSCCMERWSGVKFFVLFGIFICLVLVTVMPLQAQENPPPEKGIEDEFLRLGTEKGIGGKEWMDFDRRQIKYQIEQFIPPLLQPAFVGDAFVLPPGAIRTGFSWRYARLTGDDFFRNNDVNRAVFGNREVRRNFVDFDLFYGFDLNAKYLHSFTLKLNIPIINTNATGFVNPNGVQFIEHFNDVNSTEIGDVSLFLKKKIVDQGNFPFGIAVVFGVHFPTGKNDEKFGNNGKILSSRPDPDGDGVQASFGQLQAARTDNPKCFFANFNQANPGLCTSPAFRAPASMLSNAPKILTAFPFNNGVFGRFSDDGRLPAVLQPGTGEFAYTAGLFLTRQFHPTDFPGLSGFPGRSAFHIGGFYKFIQEEDGIDPGDKATLFASYVKPLFRDYMAVDLTFVSFYTAEDKYDGKAPSAKIANVGGVQMLQFDIKDRAPFSDGFSTFFVPSIILSPDSQMRIVASPLIRIGKPKLGPAPEFVFRVGFQFTF